MYLTRDTTEAAGTAGPVSGPSAGLYLTEPARGLAGLAFLPLAAPWLATAPHGDGHGVLVVPGFLATDTTTAMLRRFLRRLGYDVRGTSSSDSATTSPGSSKCSASQSVLTSISGTVL